MSEEPIIVDGVTYSLANIPFIRLDKVKKDRESLQALCDQLARALNLAIHDQHDLHYECEKHTKAAPNKKLMKVREIRAQRVYQRLMMSRSAVAAYEQHRKKQ